MKIEQIKADSASERVVKQLLANMEAGALKTRDRLPTQEKLAEMLGVGRSSIREATNALAIMGYLEITQGRGTFIKSTNPSNTLDKSPLKNFAQNADLFNLIEIREVLETYVVEKASQIADEEHLLQLKKVVMKLEEAQHDVAKFIAVDLEFHIALALAAKNREISEIIRQIHATVNNRVPVAFNTSRPDKVYKAVDTIKKVYEYVVSGQGKQAVRCMRNHLGTTKEALMKEIQSRMD